MRTTTLKIEDRNLKNELSLELEPTPVPVSTYRLQLNKDFSIDQARAILPYLRELGIDTVYTSPYFQAKPGSPHGYDNTNPTRFNPEIGSSVAFDTFFKELRNLEMHNLIDVVPNHMGILGNNNDWWLDVLENGPCSPYARFFDINWEQQKKAYLQGKVLLPILGDHYGRILERKELSLSFSDGAFSIRYAEHRFPVAPPTYPFILEHCLASLENKAVNATSLKHLRGAFNAFKRLTACNGKDPVAVSVRQRKTAAAKKRLARLCREDSAIETALQTVLAAFNGQKNDSDSFLLLDGLLSKQPYRLAFWRVASEEINYRRFFDINELAAIRMEDKTVFKTCNELIFRLVHEGKVSGLRIDHPDGLYDPSGYFNDLQSRYIADKYIDEADFPLSESRIEELRDRIQNEVSEQLKASHAKKHRPLYVVTEKILDRQETLPDDWNIHGTVGYEYLNNLDGLFVNADNRQKIDKIYEEYTGVKTNLDELIYEKKKIFALVHMPSEIGALANLLDQISEENLRYRDFTLNNFTVAIREVIACFPVYRTYISPDAQTVSERDRKFIHIAIEKAKRKTPVLPHDLYDFLKSILLLELTPELSVQNERLYRDFILRFQQLTGPVMAKGFEDTVCYIYNRLISLNEVGSDLSHFGTSVPDFHRYNMDRQRLWPGNLLATSTHDSKRSEDVRMRIHALSELPQEWKTQLTRWTVANEKHKTIIDGMAVPRPNLEYFIYQTLLGVWPPGAVSEEDYDTLHSRLETYILKAIREAKMHTNWINPDTVYEEAVNRFLKNILVRDKRNLFLQHFLPFQEKIHQAGMLNALSALTLKLGSPGVPDTFQGNELWNYCLVDPDNRRPVDYADRAARLRDIRNACATQGLLPTSRKLWQRRSNGTVKLFLLWRGLNLHKRCPELFSKGSYVPLSVEGKKSQHVVAFARRYKKRFAVFIGLRRGAELLLKRHPNPSKVLWQDTVLALPKDWRWLTVRSAPEDILSGRFFHDLPDDSVPLGKLMDTLPCAIITNCALEEREH